MFLVYFAVQFVAISARIVVRTTSINIPVGAGRLLALAGSMPPKTLVVPPPDPAGTPWRPTSDKQVRTLANWDLKHQRFINTNAAGDVIVTPEPFPDEYIFPSWTPDESDRRFGTFGGELVVFDWRRFWQEVPEAKDCDPPARCVAQPLGTPAAQTAAGTPSTQHLSSAPAGYFFFFFFSGGTCYSQPPGQ